MRRLGLSVVVCSLLLVLAFAGPAAAQQEKGNVGFIVFVNVKAKAGHQAEFEAAAKAHMEEVHRKGNDDWRWVAWQTITGPGSGTYGFGTFDHHWADFDNPKVSREADEADAMARMGPHTESVEATYWVHLRDLSRPGDEAEFPLETVTIFQLHQGKDGDFRRLVAKARAAAEKTNRPVRVNWWELVNGGTHPTYALTIPRANWAAMAPPAQSFEAMLEEVYGREDAADMLKGFSKSVKSVSSEIIKTRPDLSYTPAK